jgi:hypothetical protein
MRQTLVITAGLILTATSFGQAQDTTHTAPIQVVPPTLTPAADGNQQSGIHALRHVCSKCASHVPRQCFILCCANRKLIVRRYYWVPASHVGIHARVVATGYDVSGVSTMHAPVGHIGVSPVRYTGIHNSPRAIA